MTGLFVNPKLFPTPWKSVDELFGQANISSLCFI